jgi:hypothetical protein
MLLDVGKTRVDLWQDRIQGRTKATILSYSCLRLCNGEPNLSAIRTNSASDLHLSHDLAAINADVVSLTLRSAVICLFGRRRGPLISPQFTAIHPASLAPACTAG